MLLQNLTLLSNETVVQVMNIAAPPQTSSGVAAKTGPAEEGARLPVIAAPILPFANAPAPQQSSRIIVSTSAPGGLASSIVYTGEPTINGLESARRVAQAAADRAHLETMAMARDTRAPTSVQDAYAEAAALFEACADSSQSDSTCRRKSLICFPFP